MRGKWLFVSVLLLGLLLGSVVGLSMAQDSESGSSAGSSASLSAGVGSGFTYQGRLNKGGSPYDGTCDFEFSLHDALDGGNQIGSIHSIGEVDVDDGLFTVLLNEGAEFGDTALNGQARWLKIQVQCTGDGGYTELVPRQMLTPAPYALALPGLRTEQNATSPNVIGGHHDNQVAGGVIGATIAGGGQSGLPNLATEDFATVGGGEDNSVSGPYATIAGGHINTVLAGHSTVGGGISNTVKSPWATVSGGISNTVTANGTQASVGGGYANVADGINTTIGGGQENEASHLNATVGGGYDNTASGEQATIGGGANNNASVRRATIGGGALNTANGYEGSTVGGGANNTASHWYATVSGGIDNTASAHYTTIPGGRNAVATLFGEMAYASGNFAANGDAQTSLYVMRNTSVGSTPKELFLNGNNSRLTVGNNRTLTFDILVVGRGADGLSAGYQIQGVIDNDAGHTQFAGTPTVTVLGEDDTDAWASVEALDSSHDCLVLRAGFDDADYGGSIRWVAFVRTVEVGW